MPKAASAPLGSLLLLVVTGAAAIAQEPTPSQIHVAHITEHYPGVPNDLGLLPALTSEFETAKQHAGLGMQNPADLDAMKRHAVHVGHAIDPDRFEAGPGLGYGFIMAAEGLQSRVKLAARAEGGSEQMETHAGHVATSLGNTIERARQVAALAEIIGYATDAAVAAELYGQMNELLQQIEMGVDADGDGRVGWQEGEGGLAQVQQHFDLMVQAAG